MRASPRLVGAGSRRAQRERKREKKKSPPFPAGIGKDGAHGELREGPMRGGQAFHFFLESRDGYLAEVAAMALALLAS
jgi:hypothetical protein